MKIRTDFVTNSSSSSFICQICGRTESGFDIGLGDVDMIKCVNGHIICEEEMLPRPSKKEMISIIMENHWNRRYNMEIRDWVDVTEDDIRKLEEDEIWHDYMTDSGYYGIPECSCPICQFIEYSEADLARYLKKEYGVSHDDVFCQGKGTEQT